MDGNGRVVAPTHASQVTRTLKWRVAETGFHALCLRMQNFDNCGKQNLKVETRNMH